MSKREELLEGVPLCGPTFPTRGQGDATRRDERSHGPIACRDGFGGPTPLQ